MTASLRGALCDAIKDMLIEVPPADAPAQRRANFAALKAEIYDLIAVLDPVAAVNARNIANYSRFQARQILREARGFLARSVIR